MTAPETPTSGAAPAWEVRPRVVCLCGSTRFKLEYEIANAEETLAGRIVLSSGVFAPDLSDETKAMLDELHKRKIDIADEILVINPGGYIGTSTRGEIEYATAHGKPVRYLVEAEGVTVPSGARTEVPGPVLATGAAAGPGPDSTGAGPAEDLRKRLALDIHRAHCAPACTMSTPWARRAADAALAIFADWLRSSGRAPAIVGVNLVRCVPGIGTFYQVAGIADEITRALADEIDGGTEDARRGAAVLERIEAGTEDVVGWEQLKSELPGGAT